MRNTFETNFIPETIKKTPFTDAPTQNFFAEWCRIMDSIVLQCISREEWNKRRVQGILEKNNEGEQILFLPKDLRLWEMIDIIKTVDHGTLARRPEKREERAEKIQELGNIFEKAGMYLQEYIYFFAKDDDKAKQIAEAIAHEFYAYGLSLQNKEQRSDEIPQKFFLSPEDKAELDEWFLGRDAYQKRLARLGENPAEEQKEEVRKKLLFVYFKALAKEKYKAESGKPWKTKVGPVQHLQNRARRQITQAIETPEREMRTVIFRRGVEKLVTEMKEVGWRKAINDFLKKVGFDPPLKQRRLYDTLHINELKAELEAAKQTGDIAKISAKELEIAKKIQKAVSSFPYKSANSESGSNHPSKMVETQFINCVGSSILGGGLLDEFGIKYLHAGLPEHSATVLITSDGKIYWQDFTPGNSDKNYTEITSDMLENGVSIGSFNQRINDSGLLLTFRNFNPYSHKGKLRVNLFNPEIGLQCYILNNMGNVFRSIDRAEEAIEAYRQVIKLDPEYAAPYIGLGNSLSDLGRVEEAIEAYETFIKLRRNGQCQIDMVKKIENLKHNLI